jgi:hypothetical protein
VPGWCLLAAFRRPAVAFAAFRESPAVGVGHKGAHVGMTRDSGPVPGKDPSAELVLLALPHNAHTGSLEPKVKPSDPAEQRPDRQRHPNLAYLSFSCAARHARPSSMRFAIFVLRSTFSGAVWPPARMNSSASTPSLASLKSSSS